MCHWCSACIERLVAIDDPTLIPELGQAKRDAMLTHLQSASDLAACNPDGFISGKKTVFNGIDPNTLQKFHVRAKLLSMKDAKPILRAAVTLPGDCRVLFFDTEVDPMRDICYLHGFVERRGRDNATECFVAFFKPECTPAAERAAFADAFGYMRESHPCAIYFPPHHSPCRARFRYHPSANSYISLRARCRGRPSDQRYEAVRRELVNTMLAAQPDRYTPARECRAANVT